MCQMCEILVRCAVVLVIFRVQSAKMLPCVGFSEYEVQMLFANYWYQYTSTRKGGLKILRIHRMAWSLSQVAVQNAMIKIWPWIDYYQYFAQFREIKLLHMNSLVISSITCCPGLHFFFESSDIDFVSCINLGVSATLLMVK